MKHLFLSIASVAMSVLAFAQTPTVTFDFSSPITTWGLTSLYANAGTISDGTYTLTLNCPSATLKSDGSQYENGGYKAAAVNGDSTIIFGKNAATLTFPAFSFNLARIVTTGPGSGASGKVTFNIYVGDSVLFATAATGANGEHVFDIPAAYQAAGTIYTIKVTNSNNLQFKKIELYAAVAGAPENPTFSVAPGTFLETQAVELACATEGAALYYTLDGTDPTAESTLYSEAIQISEPTTVKVVAINNGVASSVMEGFFNVVICEGNGTKDNPFTASNVVAFNNGLSADSLYWVKGIIVGYYNNNAVVTDLAEAKATNVAIATGIDTIPVALADSAFRANVNIKDHPENVGCELAVKGHLVSYFTHPGVKDIVDYVFEAPQTALEQAADQKKAVKFVKDGQIYIRKGDMIYNIFGQEVK